MDAYRQHLRSRCSVVGQLKHVPVQTSHYSSLADLGEQFKKISTEYLGKDCCKDDWSLSKWRMVSGTWGNCGIMSGRRVEETSELLKRPSELEVGTFEGTKKPGRTRKRLSVRNPLSQLPNNCPGLKNELILVILIRHVGPAA